jgi:hypothetical protein
VHLLVSRHFENKHDTAPQGQNLESDQANRTDVADRGTCDLAIFGTLLCPGGGGILHTTYRRRRRKICFFPFTACFRGDQSGRVVCEMQEVAPQTGKKMRSYVAVSSSCCPLYLLLQRGSQARRPSSRCNRCRRCAPILALLRT